MNTKDTLITINNNHLFVRRWSPTNNTPPNPSTTAPIILFHDSLGCVDLWRSFPAALCAITNRPIIAYDRLGYGQSSPRYDKQSLDFVSREANIYFPALKEQLNIGRYIALGHSIGGGMALSTAIRYPTDCLAVITIAAQAFVEDKTVTGIEEAKAMFETGNNIARLNKYHGDKGPWVLNAWTETWLSADFRPWHLRETLSKMTRPLLAIHGSEDEYGSTEHPKTLVELSHGRGSVQIMPDLKHLPHRENEPAVLQLITDFIDQVL